MTIRAAQKKDFDAIRGIIMELDLAYPSQSLDSFLVLEDKDHIIGIANLEEFDNFYFLSSVGVVEGFQRRGLASSFIKDLIKSLKKDVYLYTVIPGFFEKLGFKAIDPRPDLPSKTTFSCKECTPDTCVTMVKQYEGS